jgi:ferrous iron transport protein A
MEVAMRIDELPAGRTAVITRIDDAHRDGLRLRELGFDEGVEVEVRHRGAIGGDPIAVRVGSNVVAMRRGFARLVEVE